MLFLSSYLATAATDSSLKIWDIRNLVGPLQDYRLRSSAQEVNFSQKGLLSVGMGNVVEVYKSVNQLSILLLNKIKCKNFLATETVI